MTVDDEGELGEVLGFMQALWALDHALRSASKRMGARLGLTGPQRLVIRLVGRFPGSTAGTLAALLHVHPSTLTGVLARLERRRLLQRRVDRQDGRRALFHLTDAGRDFDRTSAGTVEAGVRRAIARLSDERVRAARAVLEAVVIELGRDSESMNVGRGLVPRRATRRPRRRARPAPSRAPS